MKTYLNMDMGFYCDDVK